MVSAEELEANWRIAQQEAGAQFKRAEREQQLMGQARALLMRVEWSSTDEDGYSRCPECLGLDPSDAGIAHWRMGPAPVGSAWKGHRPACVLAALVGAP